MQFFSDGEFLRKRENATTPYEIWEKMRGLAKDLQRTPPFANTPFTHMRFEMDEKGKTQVDFAYIPEWDSWPGLLMRGITDLTEAEAKNPEISGTWGITLDLWHDRRARRAAEPYTR